MTLHTPERTLRNVERVDQDVATLDELYSKSELESEKVFIKALGKHVVIKALSLEDREELYKRSREAGGGQSIAKLTVVTIMRGLVSPKIPDKDLGVLLANKNGKYLEEIAAAIWRISGLNQDSQKNESRATSPEGTSLPSPETSAASPASS